MNKAKYGPDLKDVCYVCKKPGVLCDDLTITGNKIIVHVGKCHDRLLARDQARINKAVGLL